MQSKQYTIYKEYRDCCLKERNQVKCQYVGWIDCMIWIPIFYIVKITKGEGKGTEGVIFFYLYSVSTAFGCMLLLFLLTINNLKNEKVGKLDGLENWK